MCIRDRLLQYAAVATVCDIVDLTDENRIIVKEGFRVLEDTDNYGMRALLDRCLKPGERLSVGRVGFFIGPVINAGGRMSTAQLVMDLLFSGSREEAEDILDGLIELNEERKHATEEAVKCITAKYGGVPEEDVIIEYLSLIHIYGKRTAHRKPVRYCGLNQRNDCKGEDTRQDI